MGSLPYTYANSFTLPSDEVSGFSSHHDCAVVTTSAATTTSATYVDMASIKFVVRAQHPSTYGNFFVMVSAVQSATIAGTECWIAVQINGVDTDVAHIRHDSANVEKAITGVASFAPPTVPGFYTASLRWRRSTGTGTVTMASGTLVTCVLRER